jgi:hypothetical protein
MRSAITDVGRVLTRPCGPGIAKTGENPSYEAHPFPPLLIILPLLKPPCLLQLPALANWL